MLARLARFTVRRRRRILVVSLILFALAGVFGGGVAGHLSSGGFEDPDAESARAGGGRRRVFNAASPTWCSWSRPRGEASTIRPRPPPARPSPTSWPGPRGSTWPAPTGAWARSAPAQRRRAVKPSYWPASRATRTRWTSGSRIPAFTRQTDLLDVRVGAFAEVFRQIGQSVEKDLARAESVAIPITLLLLVVVFGS